MFGRRKKRKQKNIGKTLQIPKVEQEPVKVRFSGHTVSFKLGNAQHIGNRTQQEDSFGFSSLDNPSVLSEKGICAVLADGMGGLSNGREVSQSAVSSMLDYFFRMDFKRPLLPQFRTYVERINQNVCRTYSKDGKAGAGSTFVTAVIFDNILYWCSVGDSRLYLYRQGRMYQMNEDHDYKNRLLGQYIQGTATLEEAMNNPQKDALTSYLGSRCLDEIDGNRRGFFLQNQDRIVLVSDGIYNALSDKEMADRMEREPQDACQRLIQDVLDKRISGQDNMTVMIVSYSGE